MAECFCDDNAYALKGSCECDEECECNCDVCECHPIDIWTVDLAEQAEQCPCGGNCTCKEGTDETT